MAQRKDSPNAPGSKGAGSEGKGGGKSASGGAKVDGVNRNATTRREKPSPGGRGRGETSVADRS